MASFRLARRGVSRTFQLVRVFSSMSVRENVVAGLSFAGPRIFGRRANPGADDLLERVAALVDAGVLRTTLGEHYGRINAVNLRQAHALIESHRARGKLVLEGF
jgi:ABC-type branched-subunit amino acid transport system ATPase component